MSTAEAQQVEAAVQEVGESLRAVRERRQRKSSAVPYTDIAVCIGMKDETGARKELVHQINDEDVRIVSVQHSVQEKVQKTKDENGDLLGYEPTGEYELTIKVKYIKE